MNQEELMKLPKVELHCHMDGSLPLAFVRESLGREVLPSEVQVSPDCTSLAEYLDKFGPLLQSLDSVKHFKEGAKQFLLSLKEENVVYVEARFAPLHHANEHLHTAQIIEATIAGLEEGKALTGIEYNLIICCMRHHKEEENLQLMKDTLPYLGKGVCAMDLAGGEAVAPMCDYMNLFQKAKEMGLPFTLHAGECGNAQNIVDSIAAGAGRIGHGIAMTGMDEVKALCKEKKIALEMCPISNIQTKAIDHPDHYPLKEFLEEGLLATINTDNRTVSNTALWKEYAWIQEQYGITDEQIKEMNRTAMKASFASEEVKEKILSLLV